MELNDITGQRFGRLIAVERVDDIVYSNGKHVLRYRCLCDCGKETIVRKGHLINGSIKSCGCYHRECVGNQHRTHGYSHKERLYSVWLNMKDRCANPNNNHYGSYGGRGISICDEWFNDYITFRNWALNNGYVEDINISGRNNITIDRIDVNGNYEPDNCRFITNKENCNNKRNSMSDDERYNICPICGNIFKQKKRNGQKTCSVDCGVIVSKITKSGGITNA